MLGLSVIVSHLHPSLIFVENTWEPTLTFGDWLVSDQKIRKKLPNFSKIAQKVAKSKKGQNIHNKDQFESPKHLQQTTFETLKYLNKQCFETAYLGGKLINLLKLKVAQKVAIILGYFILLKNHNEPNGRKIAQSGPPAF